MSTSWKIHNDFFSHGEKKVEVLVIYVCFTAFFPSMQRKPLLKFSFFCCSIIEVSFSYKVYAWTEYWKIIHSLIEWVSEICLTSLIALFWNFPLFWNFLLMICNLLLMFSHFKNIWMSTLTTIIITY